MKFQIILSKFTVVNGQQMSSFLITEEEPRNGVQK